MSFCRKILILAAMLAAATPLAAHPVFRGANIVNAASYLPLEVQGGVRPKIARGSMFTVFGNNVGPSDAQQVTELPLAKKLADTEIWVSLSDAGGGGRFDAFPLFVSVGQVNAIMPSDAPLGPALLHIRYDDGDGDPRSLPQPIEVVEASVGLFTISGSGRGPAIANNFNSETDQPLNATTESAKPGQFMTLWATGLGAITGADNEQPGAVDLKESAQVEVFVAGLTAPQVLYAGRSPEFAGLDQIVFQLPENAPTGCYVPLWVRVKGGLVSNRATLSIAAEGGYCDDPLNPYLDAEAGDRSGAVALSRLTVDLGVDDIRDTGAAVFSTLTDRRWHFSELTAMPPLGACAVYTERDGSGGLPNRAPVSPIEAGTSLIVRGPSAARFLTQTAPGLHAALFGSSRGSDPPFLTPGVYSVENGGGGTGAFDVDATLGNAPVWELAGSGALIERAAGATITWQPGDPDREYVRVMLVSSSTANPNNNVTTTVLCTARADAGRLNIPAVTLANVPESAGSGLSSTALLYVGFASLPELSAFVAPGLDYGYVTALAMRGRLVDVR